MVWNQRWSFHKNESALKLKPGQLISLGYLHFQQLRRKKYICTVIILFSSRFYKTKSEQNLDFTVKSFLNLLLEKRQRYIPGPQNKLFKLKSHAEVQWYNVCWIATTLHYILCFPCQQALSKGLFLLDPKFIINYGTAFFLYRFFSTQKLMFWHLFSGGNSNKFELTKLQGRKLNIKRNKKKN